MSLPHFDQDRWFEEEVRPHEESLRAYLHRNFPDIADVDDVVQDSYMRLLAARRKAPISSIKSYLFTIAQNSAITRLRRPRVFADKTTADFAVQAVPEEGRDVFRQVATGQEISVLLEAIDALPDRCQEIFILIKLKGLTHQEAADRLGLSIQTIHVQVSRGLRKCTEFFRRRGFFDE